MRHQIASAFKTAFTDLSDKDFDLWHRQKRRLDQLNSTFVVGFISVPLFLVVLTRTIDAITTPASQRPE